MVAQKYRWDFIGLSTDEKPTASNSEKVVDGSTYYCSDTSKLYVWCKDNWYERKALGGGGGGPTVVQTTGDSTTDVMSQDATTKLVYPSGNNYRDRVGIGLYARVFSAGGVAIGGSARVESTASGAVVLGQGAKSEYQHSVALGEDSATTRQGEVFVGCNNNNYGYNNTKLRVIGGVHDGQGLHDAATVAQGNTLSTSAPTTSTVGVLGQLYTDTTNMHTYQCTAISGDTYTWTQRW